MAANNTVKLMGRLVEDPQLKTTKNGISVTSFRIAVDRPYKTGEEKQADFFTVNAWKGTAETICKYFKKGSRILLDGSLRNRSYTVDDGTSRYVTEIELSDFSFVDSQSSGGDGGNASNTAKPEKKQSTKRSKAKEPDPDLDDADLPF